LGFSPLHVVHHLLDVVQVIHELLDGAHGFAFVDGDIGFADVRPCPFHVGAGGLAKAARVQTAAQAVSAAVSWPSSACRWLSIAWSSPGFMIVLKSSAPFFLVQNRVVTQQDKNF